MKKLSMTFLNETGKKTYLRPKVASETLDAGTVKTVMDDITGLDLFEKTGEKMYAETKSAKYTETITTELF
ncbi:DUF2922 domain-containing protein [Vagococcus hydrophili]|uniref:DUF2922 domain-containing protein n=1 Tax=Vagococcus hydrophili TaxID=2714947 RepID=A0A6G8AR58_9ENTE|nr:DUF2922 domain-containing protein [Vagococcus hydrophili]QIL47413.1 DUF2922 domain-containing protein [Vagococcus hydrophili]